MRQREKLRPLLKASSGIGRGHGKRGGGVKAGMLGSGSSINGKTPTVNDRVYRFERESEEENRQRRERTHEGMSWEYKNDEAIKAIEELPDGARFTVESDLASTGRTINHYEVRRVAIAGWRRISRITGGGKMREGDYAANTRPQLKDFLGMQTIRSVTVHNNGKTYNRAKKKK